jgi:hypothetical protein
VPWIRTSTLDVRIDRAYLAGHADATTDLTAKHEIELDGAKAGFRHHLEALHKLIDGMRQRNLQLCAKNEELTAKLAEPRPKPDAELLRLRALVRHQAQQIADLTAANHANDVPLLAVEETGEVTA